MTKKILLFSIIFIFVFTYNCLASGFEKREFKRLKDIHDYEYRNCTSPECREKIDFLYREDIKQLTKYPRLYIKYGSLLDEEVKKQSGPHPDVVRYCKKRYRHDPYMREICIENRTD